MSASFFSTPPPYTRPLFQDELNIKRRSLEQERTAVHCDYFCVRPMLMLGPQPPSLVSDHGSLPGEEPLCYYYIFFHPSSPPHRDSRPASAGPHAGPLHLLERGSAGTFTYAVFSKANIYRP